MDPRQAMGELAALQRAVAQGWLSAAQAQGLAPGARGAALRELSARLDPAGRSLLEAAYREASAALESDSQATLAPEPRSSSDAQATLPPAPSQAPSHAEDTRSSDQLGPYRLIRELARGGMGAVYIARRDDLEREVALKVLLAEGAADPGQIERFQTEARLSARLKHPHIVPVLDVGRDRGQHYLAMELVRGESLKARLARGPLPPREAAALFVDLADALAYAHRQAILHRDLKPHNVLLDEQGRPLLTDFGLAKDTGAGQGLTKTGAVLGTPAYMAPEQAGGEIDLIDRRTDVYGLGAALYEALTGHPPFAGATVLNVLNAVLKDPPPAPRTLVPGLPLDLDTIVLTALAKEPEARYPSAQALGDDLRRFLADEPIQARPLGALGRAARWIRRHRRLAGVGVALSALLVAGSLAALLALGRAQVQAAESARADLGAEAARDFQRLSGVAALASGDERLVLRQSAFTAAQRWQALLPEASAPYAGLQEAMTAVQEAAAQRQEWLVAQDASEQLELIAEGSGVPAAQAQALRAFAAERRAWTEQVRRARFVERQQAVRTYLLEARPLNNERPSPPLGEILVWLVARRGPEVGAALVELSEALIAAGVRAQRDRFHELQDSARGDLERWLGQPSPASPLQLPPESAARLATSRAAPTEAHTLLLRNELGREFPNCQVEGLLAVVCAALRYVLGSDPRAELLLARLALATSGSSYVEQPLRGLMAAHSPAGQAGFDRACQLSGGTRLVPIDVIQGFNSAHRDLATPEESSQDPTDQRVRQAAAEFRAKRYSEALQLVEGLGGDNASLMRGQILNELGLWEHALLELDAPGLDTSYLAREQRGEALLRLGAPRLALREAQAAVALNPEDARSWHRRAQAELDLGQNAEAIRSLGRVFALGRNDPEAHVLAIRATRRLGQAERASRLLDDALASAPEHPELWIERARVALDRGQLDAGEQALTRAGERGAQAAQLLEVRAQLRFRQGRLEEAKRDVRDALLSEPRELEALLLRMIQIEPRNPAAVWPAIRAVPANPKARIQAVRYAHHFGQLRLGLKHLTALLYLDPARREVRYERVQFALALESVSLALADLEVLSADRDTSPTWNALQAKALAQVGRGTEALELARAARARWPDEPELALAEATALGQLEQREAAVEVLRPLLEGSAPEEIKRAAERVLESLGQRR